MARVRRACKALLPGKLTEHSKNFSLVLCVENAPQRREYKDKATSVIKKYVAITGIGEDGLRQDCVLFGEAYDKMPNISPSVRSCNYASSRSF